MKWLRDTDKPPKEVAWMEPTTYLKICERNYLPESPIPINEINFEVAERSNAQTIETLKKAIQIYKDLKKDVTTPKK